MEKVVEQAEYNVGKHIHEQVTMKPSIWYTGFKWFWMVGIQHRCPDVFGWRQVHLKHCSGSVISTFSQGHLSKEILIYLFSYSFKHSINIYEHFVLWTRKTNGKKKKNPFPSESGKHINSYFPELQYLKKMRGGRSHTPQKGNLKITS